MRTVRESALDVLRARGMTTVFGNPGSTELPMLKQFPDDFRYVLGLQEAVVVGMADGYALASGTTGLVNLHTGPGTGNAMGAILNARANRTPMVVTAGQQVRAMLTMEALLTNPQSTLLPQPAVKWAYEPRARRTSPPPWPGPYRSPKPRRRGRCSSRCRWTTSTWSSARTRTGRPSGRRPVRSRTPPHPPPTRSGGSPPAWPAPAAPSSSPATTWTPPGPGTPSWNWPGAPDCPSGRRPPRAGSPSPSPTRSTGGCCPRPSGRCPAAWRGTTWSS